MINIHLNSVSVVMVRIRNIYIWVLHIFLLINYYVAEASTTENKYEEEERNQSFDYDNLISFNYSNKEEGDVDTAQRILKNINENRELLSSTDLKTWTLTTSVASWSNRYYHLSVVVGSTIYVMGGSGSTYYNDVWKSETFGSSWTLVTATASWSIRYKSAAVVVGSTIIVLGGLSSYAVGDVWSSSNGGQSWSLSASSSLWTSRNSHTAVVVGGNTIVLMGGLSSSYMNDVWRSVDLGVTWTISTSYASWGGRYDHSSVVIDSTIYLMGGYASSGYCKFTFYM